MSIPSSLVYKDLDFIHLEHKLYIPRKMTQLVKSQLKADTTFLKDGARRYDSRLWMHYNAVCVTPAMALTRPGAGSDYMITGLDSEGRVLDGAKTYKLHLPPDVPAAFCVDRDWLFDPIERPSGARHIWFGHADLSA